MPIYKKILNRFKEPQFLLFVLISFGVWGINRLNNRYQLDVVIPIHIEGIQNPQQNERDSYYKIYCHAEAKGYEFLLYRLYPTSKMITIPLSELGQLSIDNDGMARLNISTIEGRIARMARGINVVRMYDDFLELPVKNIIQKMVKVVPNFSIDVSGGYLQLSSVVTSPDSILVSGREDLVLPVDSVLTERIDITLHSTRINGIAPISKIVGITYSQEDVEYSVVADRLIERRLQLPYHIVSSDTTGVKYFSSPTVVDLVLNISKDNIVNFDPTKIELYARYNESCRVGDDFYPICVRNLSDGVVVQYIEPSYVTILKQK